MVRQRVLVPPFVGSNPTLRTCPFSSVEQSSRLRTYVSGVRISQRTLDRFFRVCYYIKVIVGNVIHYNRQSEDTFVLDKPELNNIRAFIQSKIYKFVKEIMNSTDELVITQSWINKSGKGESHHEHVHPNSLVSGVWYPVINEQLPPIQFRSKSQRDVSLQCEKFNNFNSATFLLPMKAGELIIFPSNLTHSVPANQSETERISLSFNTWAKGSLGDINSLTYLPLERCV